MSTKFKWNAAVALGALSLASMVGCVADRPARNGVFNENQYVRKDFLIRAGDDTNPDNGWMLKATITDASEPNVFGDSAIFGLFPGSHNTGDLMHFVVTQDKLQILSNREISAVATVGSQPEVLNAWPVTNVDLKYRVNLDGETTNFYEENQELDWQVRQWVKVSFDKNDLDDLAPLGSFYTQNIANCTDSVNVSATLIPGSFIVDEVHDYMEWSVQVTLPIVWTTDALAAGGTVTNCTEAYGAMGQAAQQINRQNETVTLKYSMTRAIAAPTYQPLVIAEKDPIQRKYGPILYNGVARDGSTGLLGANAYVVRYDPTKPINWYFEQGFPTNYMPYFTKNPAELPAGVAPIPNITTIEDATNTLLEGAGAAARVSFHQFNEPLSDGTPINRAFGDVRFNILRWLESEDQQSYFAGVTSEVVDPRTGEALTSDIVFENFAIKSLYVQRIDAYLQSIGMSPAGGSPFDQTPFPSVVVDGNGATVSCSSPADVGKTVPIIPATATASHDGNSTLFQKLQQYLYKPTTAYGPLGPQDFINRHETPDGQPDTDFFNAYYKYIPYIIYADPALNPFVTPNSGDLNTESGTSTEVWNSINQEAALHQLEGQINQGIPPYDVNASTGEADGLAFMNNYKAMTLNHRDLNYSKQAMSKTPGIGRPTVHADTPDSFAMISVIQKDARHCVDGAEAPGAPTGVHWESKAEWINSLINSYWSQVFWHEFGHAMGLQHNFMASVDAPNFPPANGTNADGSTRYPLYASSVMEYNAPADRIFWTTGWAPYDQGAISWIYANENGNPANKPVPVTGTAPNVSGQLSPTYPWIDPKGFTSATNGTPTELTFLFCDEIHTRYTPLCRAGDLGTTPSEIVANAIDTYDWNYQFTNFRQFNKFTNYADYGDGPMDFVTELRRFLSLWAFDFSQGELTQKFQQIGIAPVGVSSQFYYDQLTKKFDDELNSANSMSAAILEAIVQQSAGARPFQTTYDNFFGDVTQQGIILDKVDAIEGFVSLWPVIDYDPTQAQGLYITSYSAFGLAVEPDETSIGSAYETVAEDALLSMLGGSFDAFEYAKPTAVAEFNQDTHNINYLFENAAPARPEAMEWAGGYQFNRLEDFLAFFQNIAIENNFNVTTEGGTVINCTADNVAACNYDPRVPQGYPQDTFYSNAYNQFLGPDGRRWIWAYFQDRNQWVACDQDRNIATYTQLYTYTTDVIQQTDDGNTPGAAFTDELNVNYTLDYYYESLYQKY